MKPSTNTTPRRGKQMGDAERIAQCSPDAQLRLFNKFFVKLEARGADECWPIKACTDKSGYPLLSVDKKLFRANRVALRIYGNRWGLESEYACHRCDNPGCVNPAHLFWGSHADNVQDAAKKGRLVTPTMNKTHCLNNHPFDDENTSFYYAKTRGETYRRCKTCMREKAREQRKKSKPEAARRE